MRDNPRHHTTLRIRAPKEAPLSTAPAPVLSMRDVSFSYRALPVINGLNWTYRAGEQWACLGPNGAGKSTLAKLICGRIKGASGVIERGAALARGGIAYVCFEEQQALYELERRRDASKFRFLSTGEMRRAMLRQALSSRPGLLILDSPLDGLDRSGQQEMRGIIEELLRSDSPLLLLCRSLDDLPDGASHLLVLEDGACLRQGLREEVLDDAAVCALMSPPPLAFMPPPAACMPPPLPSPSPTPSPAASLGGPLPSAFAPPPPDSDTRSERPAAIAPAQPLLQLRDVHLAYGDKKVLSGVNWTFNRGQHCCIAGPNGCGKSSLLSLINGDNHKAYGQDITLFGRRRGSGESVWDIKQKIGQVDTRLHLNHARGMRALEVAVSGFFDTIGLYDDWGGRHRQTASAWLAALGMAGMERASFDALSFGMQRMVLLARAMVKSPAILILDEPCLGLDGPRKSLILRAIDHIAARTKTQILYVSHSPSETPACINQWLDFMPKEDGGFEVVAR